MELKGSKVEYKTKKIYKVFSVVADLLPNTLALTQSFLPPSSPSLQLNLNEVSLTYEQLKQEVKKVNKEVEKTLSLLPPPQSSQRTIGVYMERGIEMIISFLAIIKGGNRFLFIEPSLPLTNIEHMITSCNLSLILILPLPSLNSKLQSISLSLHFLSLSFYHISFTVLPNQCNNIINDDDDNVIRGEEIRNNELNSKKEKKKNKE